MKTTIEKEIESQYIGKEVESINFGFRGRITGYLESQGKFIIYWFNTKECSINGYKYHKYGLPHCQQFPSSLTIVKT